MKENDEDEGEEEVEDDREGRRGSIEEKHEGGGVA